MGLDDKAPAPVKAGARRLYFDGGKLLIIHPPSRVDFSFSEFVVVGGK